MHLITYISDANLEKYDVKKSIMDVVELAKVMNPKFGITGVLFYHEGKYMQVIEGAEGKLRSLMKNIEKDDRHSNIEYVIDCPVASRGFSGWNMDRFCLSGTQKFDSQNLKRLTKSFEENLLPRADSLVFYYRALLAKQA